MCILYKICAFYFEWCKTWRIANEKRLTHNIVALKRGKMRGHNSAWKGEELSSPRSARRRGLKANSTNTLIWTMSPGRDSFTSLVSIRCTRRSTGSMRPSPSSDMPRKASRPTTASSSRTGRTPRGMGFRRFPWMPRISSSVFALRRYRPQMHPPKNPGAQRKGWEIAQGRPGKILQNPEIQFP